MLKLVSLGRPKIISHLGRVYATILRTKRIRLLVGGEQVMPFMHCVWDDSRYVEHAKWGRIHAVQRFDRKVVYSYPRCAACGSPLQAGESRCPEASCRSESTITQEERISGWVGIQRFGDSSHYGIDLVRNGRAIRLLEKTAFFDYEDPETGEPVHDYPIDQNDGRIVGEVHLDHVPVDPAKQNFERSSPEWRRAIEFVRGASSLQPERPRAESNRSPVFMLYQGYRKVRGPGRRSMTMGKWEPGRSEPKPLGRDEIEALRRRFEAKEAGYLDDREWWKLVEEADQKPVAGLIKCGECHLESPEGSEECLHCGKIFDGKECINKDCAQIIQRSALTCPNCGANQVPEIRAPWACEVCKQLNSAENIACSGCAQARGTPDPLSRDSLRAGSKAANELSISTLTVRLASGADSAPIAVRVLVTDRAIVQHGKNGLKSRLPSIRLVDGDIEIVVDATHPLFQQAGMSLEEHIAFEAAGYLYTYYQSLAASPAHSLSNLAYEILVKYWPQRFSTIDCEAELNTLFAAIRQRLGPALVNESADVYSNLHQDEQIAIASEMVRCGRDISELAKVKDDGEFVFFLRPKGVLEVFRINPRLFFDGSVWSVTYARVPELQGGGDAQLQAQIRNEYGSLLEVAVVYVEKGVRDSREAAIARAACKLLSDRLAG